MIVLIAPEHDVDNEIEILHELFREGLQYYHLRKPNKNHQSHCDYLNQIDIKYQNKIVVHHFHELLDKYNLKGIHFPEAKRRETAIKSLELIKNKKTISVSSSFHSPQELNDYAFQFDYYLLSPVFSSISKQGYQGRKFDVSSIKKTIIGMGGVTTNNLSEFTKLGYRGVGILGSIWNSKTPVEDFKMMKRYFE